MPNRGEDVPGRCGPSKVCTCGSICIWSRAFVAPSSYTDTPTSEIPLTDLIDPERLPPRLSSSLNRGLKVRQCLV